MHFNYAERNNNAEDSSEDADNPVPVADDSSEDADNAEDASFSTDAGVAEDVLTDPLSIMTKRGSR